MLRHSALLTNLAYGDLSMGFLPPSTLVLPRSTLLTGLPYDDLSLGFLPPGTLVLPRLALITSLPYGDLSVRCLPLSTLELPCSALLTSLPYGDLSVGSFLPSSLGLSLSTLHRPSMATVCGFVFVGSLRALLHSGALLHPEILPSLLRAPELIQELPELSLSPRAILICVG